MLKAGFGISTPSCGCTSKDIPKGWIPWESIFFNKKISVLVHTTVVNAFFLSRPESLGATSVKRRRAREKTPSCNNWQPSGLRSISGCWCSSGRASRPSLLLRAGLSLLGVCLQPGCVGRLGACGTGSAMGSMAAQPWGPGLARGTQHHMGRVKMAHGKLGFSPVLEKKEEDLRAPLNSVLPCFLAS